MNSLSFHADWYRAATLTERAVLRQRTSPGTAAADTELAQKRNRRWRSQSPFASESSFTRRLAQDGLDEEAFFVILGESAEIVRDRFPVPPAWLVDLHQAFNRPDAES